MGVSLSNESYVCPAGLRGMTMADPAVNECPYEYYARMHAEAPVHLDERMGLWLVTRHADIVEASHKWEVFSSHIDMRRDVSTIDPTQADQLFLREGWLVADVLSQVDPPRHTTFRKMVERLFTGPVVKRMHAYLDEHVLELMAPWEKRGHADFLNEFALLLPLDVVADQLGLPRTDGALLRRWSDAFIASFDPTIDAPSKLALCRIILEFQRYFVAWRTKKAEQPGDDLLSMLVATRRDDGQPLSTEEYLALCAQLMVAGSETTRNHLLSIMLMHVRRPRAAAAAARRSRADPALRRGIAAARVAGARPLPAHHPRGRDRRRADPGGRDRDGDVRRREPRSGNVRRAGADGSRPVQLQPAHGLWLRHPQLHWPHARHRRAQHRDAPPAGAARTYPARGRARLARHTCSTSTCAHCSVCRSSSTSCPEDIAVAAAGIRPRSGGRLHAPSAAIEDRRAVTRRARDISMTSTVLVTGANRGIGLELARQYAADGWQVIATARRPAEAAELQSLQAASAGRVRLEPLDLADFATIDALAARLSDSTLDVLVSNGAQFGPRDDSTTELPQRLRGQLFGSIDHAAMVETLRVNAVAPLHLAEVLRPNLQRSARGKLVMISSSAGSIAGGLQWESPVQLFVYPVSKATLNKVTATLSMVLKADGIVTVALCPGHVRTRLGGPGASLSPEESAVGLRRVIAGLGPTDNGRFIRYDGASICLVTGRPPRPVCRPGGSRPLPAPSRQSRSRSCHSSC